MEFYDQIARVLAFVMALRRRGQTAGVHRAPGCLSRLLDQRLKSSPPVPDAWSPGAVQLSFFHLKVITSLLSRPEKSASVTSIGPHWPRNCGLWKTICVDERSPKAT